MSDLSREDLDHDTSQLLNGQTQACLKEERKDLGQASLGGDLEVEHGQSEDGVELI